MRTPFEISKSLFGILSLLFPVLCVAQSTAPTSRTPGAPAGSYKLGDFDQVNLYSGNLNFNLPLLNIGGRGEATQGMSLTIERQWGYSEQHEPWQPPGYNLAVYSAKVPDASYGAGFVKLSTETVVDYQDGCLEQPPTWRYHYRLNVTYVDADGTEYILRDRVLHGAPFISCGSDNLNLGNVFEASDPHIVFISDSNINLETSGRLDGYLLLPNGIKKRVVDPYNGSGGNRRGEAVWTEDRNGNRIEFSGQPGNTRWAKDSLGREINVVGNQNYTSISFKGSGGANREIRILYNGDFLRTTQPYDSSTLKTNAELFANGDPGASDYLYQANSIADLGGPSPTGVLLPDGRSYQFRYNVYGQLARVVLPTGGALEYDYYNPTSSGFGNPAVVNRVKEKRVYREDGRLENKTVFTTSAGMFGTREGTIVTVEQFDAANNRLNKALHYFYGIVGGQYGFETPWWNGKEFRTEFYDSNGSTLLRKTEQTWGQNIPSWCSDNTYGTAYALCGTNPSEYAPSVNTVVLETTETLADAALVKKTTSINPQTGAWAFDGFNNPTDIWEYDYFGSGQAGQFLRRTHTDYVTAASYTSCDSAVSQCLQSLPSQKWVSSDLAGSNKVSLTKFEYDNYTNDANDPNHAQLTPRSSVVEHDTSNYGAGVSLRGNATGVTSYSNAALQSGAVTSYSQYDILGNVVKTVDARGYASTISYEDNFGWPDGEARTNTVPSQLNGQSTFAFPTTTTNTLGWTTRAQYDYYLGAEVDEEDVNGVVDSTFYDDSLDRETKQIEANNFPSLRRQTRTIYDDINHRTEIRSDLFEFGDELSKSESFYDGLGRTTQSREYEAGGGHVAVKYEYDSLGRISKLTNPYRPLAGEQEKWKITRYDALGRIIETETPDGGIMRTSFHGNETTVTDQASRSRKSQVDALGRLKKIFEDPILFNDQNAQSRLNYETSYEYDVLGNLITATQGEQTRIFVYDSLSRLKSATNPESGTVTFTYDANNNLLTKTDARGITVEHSYDALNRPLTKNYSDSTPDAAYTYDDSNIPNSRGKLTKLETTTSINRYTSFDVLGRTLSSRQETAGQVYDFTYSYDLSGNIKSETYPSTRVVNFDYSSDGDLSKVYGRANPDAVDRTYASNFVYTAHGKIQSVRLGNGKFESTQFNSTLQPVQIGLGSSTTDTGLWRLTYNYGTTDNNGNIKSQAVTVPTIGQNQGFTAVQTYTYDVLNRLQQADEKPLNFSQDDCNQNPTKCWKQSFTYDRYGNRRFDMGQTTIPNASVNLPKIANPTISTQNNRFVTDQDNDGNNDYEYDPSGNLTRDAEGRRFAYNGENKQTEVRDVNNQVTAIYEYDGDGSRVKKMIPATGEVTIYVYDADGDLSAEYTVNAPPTQNPTTNYLTSDTLGSPRVITDSVGDVVARRDFLPFGEEIEPGVGDRSTALKYGSDSIAEKFTGKKRDSETVFDYFDARYYASKWGRFTTSDEFVGGPEELIEFDGMLGHNPTFYAEPADPQTLNKYQYSLNNPLRYIDPDGHQTVLTDPLIITRTLTLDQQRRVYQGIDGLINSAVDGLTEVGKKVGGTIKSGLEGVGRAAEDNSCGAQGYLCPTIKFENKVADQPVDNSASNSSTQQNNGSAQNTAKPRGSRNSNTAKAAAEGRRQHKAFAEKVRNKPGWKSEKSVTNQKTGQTVRPDAQSRRGKPVELKPNTPSGRRKGAKQLKDQEDATGKRGRVIYYDPNKKPQ